MIFHRSKHSFRNHRGGGLWCERRQCVDSLMKQRGLSPLFISTQGNLLQGEGNLRGVNRDSTAWQQFIVNPMSCLPHTYNTHILHMSHPTDVVPLLVVTLNIITHREDGCIFFNPVTKTCMSFKEHIYQHINHFLCYTPTYTTTN